MGKRELLSVIIPAYNEEKAIERTLASVVEQKTDFDFEIIVIDDGSSDDTVKVAKRFLEKHDVGYRVVSNAENLGLAKSINRGIELSNKRSDFVMILHSDIVLKNKDWIKKAVKYFSDEHVVAVTGKYTVPSLERLDLVSKFCFLKYFRQSIRQDGVYEISFIEDRCNIYRKKILKTYLFESDLHMSGEDQDLAYRLLNDGYKLMYDSSLIYEAFLSTHQNSYFKVLKHEMNYSISQVSINLVHWNSIKVGTKDSNLRMRMIFRLVQVFNVLVVSILLILQQWEMLIIVFLLRYLYSAYSYSRLDNRYVEVGLFSLLDYFTDFAYFLGVLIGIWNLALKLRKR